MTTTNGTKKAAPTKRQPPKKGPAQKQAPKAEQPKAEAQPDSALIKRYEAAAGKGPKAEADFLLQLFAEHERYSVVRRLIGKGPGFVERRLDKLTGSHPETSFGRKRGSVTTVKPAPAAKKASPAKKAPAAKRVRKMPAKEAS